MPSGQALIDSVAAFINFDDSTGRPYVVFLRDVRRVLNTEQAAMGRAGQAQRTDTGVMTLNPLSGGPPQRIPTIIRLGGDGATAGEDGHDATLHEPTLSGHILIASAGKASRAVAQTTRGGSAQCLGAAENLVIALGGHGGTPWNPPTMPYGANGTDGGDGGSALAVCLGAGCVAEAQGGDGGWGSPGQVGRPGGPGWFFPRPPAPPGRDGNDGDGGDAIIVAGNHATLFAFGGKATLRVPSTLALGPTTAPGRGGADGTATIHHGPIDVRAYAQNGNSTPGRIIVR
jgi:hypothetical protein